MSNKFIDFFYRFDEILGLEPPEEVQKQIASGVAQVNREVVSKTGEPEITVEDVIAKTIDAGKREDVVDLLENIPIFSGCENWRQVIGVIKREKLDKEIPYIQIFMGGLCLVLIDNVNDLGRVLGRLMIRLGYNKSKLLQSYAPREFVYKQAKVDIKEILQGKP